MEQLKTKKPKISRKKYYLIYSGVFLFCAFVMILYLTFQGKTNINFVSDGMNQHFRSLLYYSQYLKNMFINHEIPLWDFSLGEGSDIINTLHSDAVGDPLTFLSVLIPEKFLIAFYFFNAYIRAYLAGIFFSMLCFYTGEENEYGVLAGAIVYSFCFWSLQSLVLHIYFLTPLMFLPLLILGVEKIINDDKPYVFVIAVFLGSISWLYFFYMEALATAIYGLARLINKHRTDLKTIVIKLIRILGFAILGVMMAAIIVCPMVFAYMGDSRMGNEGSSVSLLYSRFFYERLFTIFVSNDSPYDMCMGYASACLFGIALLLKDFKKKHFLITLNMICLICICVPMLGKIWNGFSYVSERWTFVIALPIAYTLVSTWEEYKDNKKYLVFALIVIVGLSLFTPWSRTERVFVPVIFCFVFYGVACFLSDRKLLNIELRQLLMISIIIFNVFYIYEFNLSPRGGDVISDLLTIEEAENISQTSEAFEMKKIMKKETDFSRYTGNYLTNNASMTHKTNSTNFYFSITNPCDQKFRQLLSLRDRISWQLQGYDDRAELETLANVRYYIAQESYSAYLPYGFSHYKDVEGYRIYKNDYELPFGYTYSKTMGKDDWYKLNAVEKQEVMIQALVSDETETSDSVRTNSKTLHYETAASDNILLSDNQIMVSNKWATLTLQTKGNENEDYYLVFEGLKFSDSMGLVENDQTYAMINVETKSGAVYTIYHETPTHRYYYGKNSYVVYLGHNPEDIQEIKISFSLPGTYSFGKMDVLAHSMDEYDSFVKELSKDHLEEVSFEVNSITGKIRLEEDKYLLLSVPYSKGWKAYVDGKETELLKGNEHYLTLSLTKGEHNIKLRYMTPGLILGLAISVSALVSFIIYIILFEKKVKKV